MYMHRTTQQNVRLSVCACMFSNSGSHSPVGSDSSSPASYLDQLNEERLEKEIIEAAVKRSLEDSMQVHGSYVQCVNSN
jgi:hypothetical protein